MRDRDVRQWEALVRERANREWRELSPEVVNELACHLADLHAAAMRDGASDADARHKALDTLRAASFLELSRRPRARPGGGYGHDIRIALRQLAGSPVLTMVAVLSLALGIGANTAIFSLVNSLLLRSLPVKDPQQLALLKGGMTNSAGQTSWTFAIWQELRRRPDLVDSAFAWDAVRFNLANGGVAEFVDGIWTTAGMFDTLGVSPLLGRTFTDADDRRGGGPDGPVAVVSYGLWQRRFAGAADVIGRRLTLERIPFTIVGVMPPDFFGPNVGQRVDVVIPMGAEPLVRGKESALDSRDWWWLSVMVRLKPGQSIDEATEALRGVQPQIRSATLPVGEMPAAELDRYLSTKFTLVPAATGDSSIRLRYGRPLLTVMIVVVLVLLIACANIANLQLARAAARRHEWSVRLALGASRWRLVRLLLIESLALSTAGAGLGFLIARWGSQLLVQQLSTPSLTVFLDLSPDWRVLAFTSGVAVATALLFGAAPAFRAAAVAPAGALRASAAQAVSVHSRGVPRRGFGESALVVAQVALSVTLVVAATLFLRTFSKLATLNLGFEPARVLVVTMNAQRAAVEPSRRMAVYQRALEAVQALPGVERAALSVLTPISGHNWGSRFDVSNGVPLADTERSAYRNQVTPGFFDTYGQQLVAGRPFTDRDRDGAPRVAIVNQAFARRFLNGANPIGHSVHLPLERAPEPDMEIVGVVGDAVYRRLRDPAPPTLYSPVAQTTTGPATTEYSMSVRAASGSPAQLSRSIADAIGGVNPELTVAFQPLAEQVKAALTQERLVAILSGFFGALALLLAGLGLYGVTSYAVSRQRTEIGIRMALGAPPRSVVRLVLSRVTMLIGVGVAIGLGVSLWASQFVAALLYGIEPRDPAAFAGSAAVLAAVGALAGWLPASRASRIDPVQVLRDS
jgi:putative ABC transport system permease protein